MRCGRAWLVLASGVAFALVLVACGAASDSDRAPNAAAPTGHAASADGASSPQPDLPSSPQRQSPGGFPAPAEQAPHDLSRPGGDLPSIQAAARPTALPGISSRPPRTTPATEIDDATVEHTAGGALGSEPEPTSSCGATGAEPSATRPRRIWKLTPDQLGRSAHALLPNTGLSLDVLPDGVSTAQGGFSNLAKVQGLSAPHVEGLMVLADEFAEGLLADGSAWPRCLEGEPLEARCVQSFLTEFLQRSFRRPPQTSEVQRYTEFFVKQIEQRGLDKALRQLARVVFLSPRFQFRTELGAAATGVTSMTQYERASALSYGLADAPPDEALMNAAAQSLLSTPEQLETQVRRLLDAPESGRGIRTFLVEHFGIESVLAEDRDEKEYPNWYWGLARRLVNESEAFFDEVLWRDDARLSTLLTADYSVVNDELASVYGLELTDSIEPERRTLPAGQRSGVLTQAAFLASMGGYSAPDITRRGAHLRTRILCQELPPPPMELPPITAAEGLSRRERLETVHLENPACRHCHRLIDPLGFALEHYDSVGRWRAEERLGEGKIAIDARGTIVASSQGDLAVQGGQELGRALAALPEVEDCFVQRLSQYLAGGQHRADDCRTAQASETFRATDGAIFEAVVALLTDESSYRRGH